MMNREKELVLYQRIKTDDRKALEILFRHYYSSLCNFALQIVKKPEVAEEVVADIFFILWRDRHHLEITHSLKAYLFKAVKNHSLRTSRTLKDPFFEQIEELHDQMALNGNPETDYLYDELQSTYRSAFETLPEKCRLVFKLHKIDGLKYQEVSQLLDISVKTVENQMLKALKIIRGAMRQYQVEEC